MFTPSACACLLLFVAAPIGADPPAGAKGDARAKAADPMPAVPAVAADAPPLRKVQIELVKEGLTYLSRCGELIRSDTWVASDFRRYADVLTETCRVAAELEEKPADRVPWFEARVRRMKAVEAAIDRGVRAGSVAPQELNLIRFQRLQAEVELLKLKAAVEKPGGK